MARLLLVEDEQVNREMFRRRLERKGYTVITAENGLGAVALTQSESPDLVLMDLGLPDIDGWDATRRVKADPATAPIPVIVLSAHATSDAKEKAFAAGCQDFETKPVNWDVLFRKIEEWLAKAREAAARAAEEAAARARAAAAATGVLPRAQTTRTVPATDAPTGTMPALPKLSAAPAVGEKDVCAVQPKRILVVEDNDANRAMLCRRLNKHGYLTTEAANGREALDVVRKHPFDLVLCDIMMPGVDGYEVLSTLKADPELEALPVIMVSALDNMEGIVRCIELGAEDYLQKPYEPVLMFARINACLDKRRLREQELASLRAVEALIQAAERVEQGEFDPAALAPIAARADDLGRLARVFAHMAEQVQSRMTRLQADVRHVTSAESDLRAVIHEVARVTTPDGLEKLRKHAEEALARRQSAPDPMTETMVLKKLPKPS